jgi:hypothetical protein
MVVGHTWLLDIQENRNEIEAFSFALFLSHSGKGKGGSAAAAEAGSGEHPGSFPRAGAPSGSVVARVGQDRKMAAANTNA